MHTFAGEERWLIPIIDAVQVDTGANSSIIVVECWQLSQEFISLKLLINTGVKMYTFVGEARWSIPMIDAVQLDTDANIVYKHNRM